MTDEQHHPFTDYQKKSKQRITLTLAGVGFLVSFLLIALLVAIGTQDPDTISREKSDEVIELLQTPRELTQSTAKGSSVDIGIELPEGGWVQQTDSLGNLVQQYRCESLDPNPPNLPDGWIEMTKPEIELYISDNKVIRITGDRGIANASPYQ